MLTPTKFNRRNPEIYAVQHDGTDAKAIAIVEWIKANGGTAEVLSKGSVEFNHFHAYIRLHSFRAQNLVGPSGWVVMVDKGVFFAVIDADFQLLYKPFEGEQS